jgi:hypothetical protein
LKRWLREPLLHFAVLGLGLFALYRLTSSDSGTPAQEIVVDAPRIAALGDQFLRTWRRPPTPDELDGLVQSYVRDEVLYREGLALGLDRDDPVVRSRIRLKMEVLGDGLDADVSDADLQAWLDANADRYAAPARYDLSQVFFDPARRGQRLEGDLDAALRGLGREPAVDPVVFGDATLLPGALRGVTRTDVAAQFGEEIAGALPDAPLGRWFGPVRSGYGAHLVRVESRELAKPAALEDARAAVERDVLYARAEAANDALYERLRARYTVRIDEPADGLFEGSLAAEPQ